MAAPLLNFGVVTLFPEIYPGPLGTSLSGKALQTGIWALQTTDLRHYGKGPHQQVDDVGFGGGPGMVLLPEVVDQALASAQAAYASAARFIYFTPRGAPLKQKHLKGIIAAKQPIVCLCGRYEGVDQRVIEAWQMEEFSMGDYILSSGDLAALSFIDACVRLLPGVIGKEESLFQESFELDLLEYPHYTRPQVWQGRAVPEVLVGGHHAKIKDWRQAQAAKITQERRPDLWALYLAKKGL